MNFEKSDNSDCNGLIGLKLAPYNPTNIDAINIALDLLNISSNSNSVILYDLGCGDARLLIEAFKRNPNGRYIGIEYDINIYNKAIDNISSNNMKDNILIHHENVMNIDFTTASHIFIYLVPEGMKLLRNRLIHLIENDVTIVTYVFSIPDVIPKQIILYKNITKLYLYQK